MTDASQDSLEEPSPIPPGNRTRVEAERSESEFEPGESKGNAALGGQDEVGEASPTGAPPQIDPRARLQSLLSEYMEDDPARMVATSLTVATLPDSDVVIAAAWASGHTFWEMPDTPEPHGFDEKWLWIWEGVRYDPEALARAAGLPDYLCHERLQSLAARRLVFPDGTVSRWIPQLAAANLKRRLSVPKSREDE